MLVALAGLGMALAGASGWGEVPARPATPIEMAPPSEIRNGPALPDLDAGPPDAPEDESNRLVGML